LKLLHYCSRLENVYQPSAAYSEIKTKLGKLSQVCGSANKVIRIQIFQLWKSLGIS